jgi:hypothetical protein
MTGTCERFQPAHLGKPAIGSTGSYRARAHGQSGCAIGTRLPTSESYLRSQILNQFGRSLTEASFDTGTLVRRIAVPTNNRWSPANLNNRGTTS